MAYNVKLAGMVREMISPTHKDVKEKGMLGPGSCGRLTIKKPDETFFTTDPFQFSKDTIAV